jgi:hypothetical protein
MPADFHRGTMKHVEIMQAAGYIWPYLCVPLAFFTRSLIRKHWLVQEISIPSKGGRVEGANLAVFIARAKQHQQAASTGASKCSQLQLRYALWPAALVAAILSLAAAHAAPSAAAALLVALPLLAVQLLCLSTSPTIIFVAMLSFPLANILYHLISASAGESRRSQLVEAQFAHSWFALFSAVSFTWTLRDAQCLRAVRAEQTSVLTANATSPAGHAVQQSELLLADAAQALLCASAATHEELASAQLTELLLPVKAAGASLDAPVPQTLQCVQLWRAVVLRQEKVSHCTVYVKATAVVHAMCTNCTQTRQCFANNLQC